MKKQFTLAATALIAGISLLSACKKEEVVKKYARVNVVHAGVSTPGVNIILSDSTKLNNFVLQYLGNTGYQKVEEGTKMMNVNTFLVGSKDTLLTKTELILKEKMNYSVFIVDSFSTPTTIFVGDDWKNPENGQAMIRMLQLSPNAPRLDVSNDTGKVYFKNMAYKNVSGYTPIDAGVYQWELRDTNSTKIIAELPTMIFNTGKVYTIYIHGIHKMAGEKRLMTSMIVNQD